MNLTVNGKREVEEGGDSMRAMFFWFAQALAASTESSAQAGDVRRTA
jgi:hypothetical protein